MKNYENEIKQYYDELAATFKKLDYTEISKTMNALTKCYENGGTVYVFGNGGSSATASHMVCDFNKGVSFKKSKKFNFSEYSKTYDFRPDYRNHGNARWKIWYYS